MGIWERFKKAFVGVGESELTPSGCEPAPRLPDRQHQEPAAPPKSAGIPPTEPHRQSEATKKFYEAEKRRAHTAGQTVKGYRARYIPAEEVKSLLVAGPDGLPPLKLVPSNNGLDLTLPGGKLVDYKTLALLRGS